MAWPVAADVAARTGVDINDGTTEYGLSVTDLLAQAKSFCETYCDRQFDEAEVTEVQDWSPVLSVARPPIIEVDEILVDDVEIEDFDVYPSYIRISGYSNGTIATTRHYVVDPLSVEITYTGGYSDESGTDHVPIPDELKAIVLEMACRELLKINTAWRDAGGATQFSLGNYSVTYGSAMPWTFGGGRPFVNEDLMLRLDKFRRVTV